MVALLRPNAKEKAKNGTYLNENVVISGNIAQLPGECNLWNVSEQAWLKIWGKMNKEMERVTYEESIRERISLTKDGKPHLETH